MARKLVWLENGTFAAWGCEACGWIMSNPPSASSDRPSAEVKEAFNKHECQKHPRKPNQTQSLRKRTTQSLPAASKRYRVCHPQHRAQNKADLPEVYAQRNT